ncbi:MAG: class I SAM-dependent methyltransferase [Acidobacteria bacterium]|nr:MAG: class I SAM-dependent methyltransferase [Acidobacteriota bacterium]REK03185.1 MAG: class I SAM-dependent methyltransferase [Acidobacteriota bacterium]
MSPERRGLADRLTGAAISLAERALVPDAAIRLGARRLCRARLRGEAASHRAAGPVRDGRDDAGLADPTLVALTSGPIAMAQELANQQHYEVPVEFFHQVLGPRLKYSCCLWSSGTDDLDRAESDMLELTCERASLVDGQQILELGCGWGSLTLWMARRYPNAEILAVSNSRSQRLYIEGCCRDEGLRNVEVRTADVASLELSQHPPFDRVISVEMFEHLRNWSALLHRIGDWLAPDGRLFLHFFCHRQFAYLYRDDGAGDWMARSFFSGGLMPSWDLLRQIPSPLVVEQQWKVSGRHYESTCNAWLERLDRHDEEVLRVFEDVYGEDAAARWIQRWRLFFMACAELFGYAQGEEWMVAHALLAPRHPTAR